MKSQPTSRQALSTSRALAILATGALFGCTADSSPDDRESSATAASVSLDGANVAVVLSSIEPSAVETHIRILADDSLEGRAPGTRGFEGASQYVESILTQLGLAPAGIDGSFRQPVPLQESMVVEDASGLSLVLNDGTTDFVYAEDFTLGANHLLEAVSVTAPMVFAGYGVSAPAFGYDDFAEADLSGKIVLYLTGAPPSLPNNERAYFSSGAVKRAEMAARGAVGMVSFTYPENPRFRWEVGVARSRRGAFTWLDGEGTLRGGTDSLIRGSANLNHSAVASIFADSPVPTEQIFARAAESTPQAFDVPGELTIRTSSAHRPVQSHNVVARLEGSDPALSGQHVVYVAHMDHFGIGTPDNGDEIYNGAHDNASGVSIVLEIARGFSNLSEPPRRSVLFLFVTAEEWGLLGSDYFVNHPTVPREGLVANLALDMPFLFHPLHDIVPYGAEHSTLSEAVGAAADRLGITLAEDPIPEQVLFIRSDHYSFVRQGIPALFIKSGFETGDPALDGGAMNSAYRRDRYHTPHDEADQEFDFGAGADHARVNFLTGYHVAMQDAEPDWNVGDFFGGLFGGQ
jgi:hypothetical protein